MGTLSVNRNVPLGEGALLGTVVSGFDSPEEAERFVDFLSKRGCVEAWAETDRLGNHVLILEVPEDIHRIITAFRAGS